MCRTKIVISALLVTSIGSFAADNASSLQKKNTTPSALSVQDQINQKKNKNVKPYEDSNDTKIDVKKVREQIRAIDLVLKNDKQIEYKIDLYIKKSYLLYSLGKKSKFNSTQAVQQVASDYMPYFDKSLSIIDQLQTLDNKKPILKNPQRALIHFIRGSINYELNKEVEMLKEYNLSLSFNKSTAQAASMELIIAEYYFDHDKFEEAIVAYQELYKLYDNQQKAIADYKTAWCFLIKKNYLKSEEYFLKAVNIKPEHSLIEDTIKDLAYISTQLRNEEQNLAFSLKTFPEPKRRGVFLLSLIRHLYSIDKKKIPYKLFNEAFRINKELKEKVQILGLLISYERQEYPSHGQILAFGHLQTLVSQLKGKNIKEQLADAKQLPDDLEYYIKIFVDGYLQKIQSRKITDRGEFAATLNKLIPFYIAYFATDKNILTYYSLWIDIGRREESLALLESIRSNWESHKETYAQTDLDLKIDNRVRVEIIALLEKNKKPDATVKEKLLHELVTFSEKFPNDINILPISKRISEIFLLDQKYKEAIPYLKTIYVKEPQATNYYNLKLAAFQLGDYDSITNDPETKKYENEKRILELIRESRLKQAVSFYEKNDFGKYEESIKTYLESKPDEKKSLIVYSDYFSKLLDRKQVEKFCSEYTDMDKKLKNSKDIMKYIESSLDQIVGEGNYLDCDAFEKFTDSPIVNYKVVLYLRSLKKKMSESEVNHLAKLDIEKRHLVLGLMALIQPEEAVSYFKKIVPNDKEDKKIYLLALKMDQKIERPVFKGKQKELLSPFLPELKVLKPVDSKIDKQISQFFYPTPKMKIDRYSKAMEDVFYRIKILRKTFLKESPKMPDEQRSSYLVKMSETENKVAQIILDSPRPSDLEPEALVAYNKQITEAAAEYQNQGLEYIKIRDEIEKQNTDKKAQIEAQKVPDLEVAKWFWPSGSMTDVARNLTKEHGAFAALVYLEYQRTSGKLKDNDYSAIRAGVLLSHQKHETMRNYVRDELISSGFTPLVEEWRKLK